MTNALESKKEYIGFYMRCIILLISFYLCFVSSVNGQSNGVPAPADADWLINPIAKKAAIHQEGNDVIMENGILRRVVRIAPNAACTDYTNLSNGQQLLRSIKPEARLTLDGHAYNIGGLAGQRENGYLLSSWVDSMKTGPEDF